LIPYFISSLNNLSTPFFLFSYLPTCSFCNTSYIRDADAPLFWNIQRT